MFPEGTVLFWTCHSKQMFRMERTAASIGSDSCCSADSRAAVVGAFLTVRPLFCLPEYSAAALDLEGWGLPERIIPLWPTCSHSRLSQRELGDFGSGLYPDHWGVWFSPMAFFWPWKYLLLTTSHFTEKLRLPEVRGLMEATPPVCIQTSSAVRPDSNTFLIFSFLGIS